MDTPTFDAYKLHTPSGGTFELKVETPLTPADREWMHRIIDLIVGIADMASITKDEITQEA
jgi:hypothetical protein